jgi:isoleucyl-tRNA synthetase
MAPFTPFFAEYLHQALHNANTTNEDANAANARSVHLEEWPSAGKVDEKILKEMEEVRKIVSLGLEARAKANIKVRQPLAGLKIRNPKSEILNKSQFTNLIKEEINVKEIVPDTALPTEVELDTTLTPELKEEGMFRELTRFIQEMRKKSGFRAGEPAVLTIAAEGPSRRFVEQHEQELSRVASLKNILVQEETEGEPFEAEKLRLSLRLTRD